MAVDFAWACVTMSEALKLIDVFNPSFMAEVYEK